MSGDTHPNQDLNYINLNPEFRFEALGDIFGYYYTLTQNSWETADENSDLAIGEQVDVSFEGIEDGVWHSHAVPVDNDLIFKWSALYIPN